MLSDDNFVYISSTLERKLEQAGQIQRKPYCHRCETKGRLGFTAHIVDGQPLCVDCFVWHKIRPRLYRVAVSAAVLVIVGLLIYWIT